MALQRTDVVALSKANPETMSLDFNSRAIMTDPDTRNRLIAAKLIVKGGKLTKKGIVQFEKVMERLGVLREGVSINERKVTASNAIFLDEKPAWFYGEASQKPWVANTEVLFLGRKPDKAMNAEKGTSSQRKSVPVTLRGVLKGKKDKTLEVKPYAFQMDEFDGIELIWLKDADDILFIPLQAKYFDYIQDRFPKVTYHIDEDNNGNSAVQLRVKNQGIKFNCVGLIMPVKLEDFIPIPSVTEGE